MNHSVRPIFTEENQMKKIILAIASTIVSFLLAQTFSGDLDISTKPEKNKRTQIYTGKVISVSDGDTIRVVDKHGRTHKIRLAYVDAPESSQAYGKEAQRILKNWVLNERVTVYIVDIDQYQREVAQITQGNENINFKLIQNGHVWHYRSIAARKQSPDEFRQYEYAESEAKKKRIGLWETHNPQAPWQYRKEHRSQN